MRTIGSIIAFSTLIECTAFISCQGIDYGYLYIIFNMEKFTKISLSKSMLNGTTVICPTIISIDTE